MLNGNCTTFISFDLTILLIDFLSYIEAPILFIILFFFNFLNSIKTFLISGKLRLSKLWMKKILKFLIQIFLICFHQIIKIFEKFWDLINLFLKIFLKKYYIY